MDYDKLFEDLKTKAEAEGKARTEAIDAVLTEALFHALGQDPEMVAFPLDNLKKSIEGLQRLIKQLKASTLPLVKDFVPVVEGCCKAMQACAMAIWYKEKAIERLVDGIIDNPMKIHEEFLSIRNSLKE